jgi:Tfp pilus assembly protein PilF
MPNPTKSQHKSRLVTILLVAIAGCAVTPKISEHGRIDEIPMYGGLDRTKVPELRAADEKFKNEVVAHYGSMENASRVWVEQGFNFYKRDDLGLAMRRFNQAWILNPRNPEVYAGFAAVLNDSGRHCEAMEHMDRALSLNPPQTQGIYTDAASVTNSCAINGGDQSARLTARSEALYKKAEEVERDKRYLYEAWINARRMRAEYTQAWQLVIKARAAGHSPSDALVARLRREMPEPPKSD